MIETVQHYAGGSIDTDICIIGAGPAGLTVSRYFANAKHRLVLIESGDQKYRSWPQKLSRGANTGHPYEPLHLCRVRRFGGTTGAMGWGAWCKPLAEEDFVSRPWAGVEGWPISLDEMRPYYAKAAQALGIPARYDWTPRDVGTGETGALLSEPVALSPFPDFGASAHEELASAPNVQVLLNTTAINLQHEEGFPAIRSVLLRRRESPDITVTARYFVIACGGIENARLLLVSHDRFSNGLGNNHDLVGRFFMEHPHFRWGHFQIDEPADFVRLHNPREAQQAATKGIITPTCQPPVAGLVVAPDLQEKEGILRSRSWIKPTGPAGFGAGVQALQDLTFWFRKGRTPANILRNSITVLKHTPEVTHALRDRLLPRAAGPVYFSFDTIMEQKPDPRNRVTLGTEADAFGLPRARLNVTLDDVLERSFRRTQEIITTEMKKLGAHCPPSPAATAFETLSTDQRVRWVRHHMGTTRMGHDVTTGVVDANCRVFEVPNLFVAGSSVFPTGGNDMPTMTIVALAQRLAEHLTTLL